MEDLKLYDCYAIEKEIEELAQKNDGEISDEDFQALCIAQTKSKEKLEGICKYIKHLEYFAKNCKEEKALLNEKQKRAENKIENIKKFINPYVQDFGPIDAGAFRLSDRISHSVEIVDEDKVPKIYKSIEKIVKIDKKAINKALSGKKKYPAWAKLNENHNTQIK